MTTPPPRHRRMRVVAALALVLIALAGCAVLDQKQREWIFQPSQRTWAGAAAAAEGMSDAWITYTPADATAPVTLHALWLAQPHANAPVLLYLHGARWDVRSSAQRMRRMHDLGFAVLGIDYRGFGQSSPALPSEASAQEDALAAWHWLAVQQPQARRYLFGHSLGAALAVSVAGNVDDAAGVIVEGSFTSMADVVRTTKWGWLPVAPLITQRFDAGAQVERVKAPLLVVHGSQDQLIQPTLGFALFERARMPKRFMLVEGGTHHNTSAVGHEAYRQAVAEFFGVGLTN
jgi:alpha-beta hydrolase superfamily lysophospholipase